MSTTTFSMRVDDALLARIDNAAAQHGQTRTDYVLSWLPVYYDRDTDHGADDPSTDPR